MTDSLLRLILLARDQNASVQEIEAFIQQQAGVDVVGKSTDHGLDLDQLEADLVITLGGDGAILRACRQLGRDQVPLMGVNLGRLGFLADLSPEAFQENFHYIQDREYKVAHHLMFECTLKRADGSEEQFLGLNEVALFSGAALQMLDIQLHIDGQAVTTFSGDGLIVSTPVGSTAHSLSAGGPILQQTLQAFVITPVCPHTLTNRPIVESADCVYQLSMDEVPEGVTLVIDGQVRKPLASGDKVEIRRSDVTFQLARIPGHNYYRNLRRKLGWGGQLRYRKR